MANDRTRKARRLALGGMLAALASILMFLEIGVPLVPSFLRLDFSELPALIGAFTLGPLGGAAVCLIKNLVHLTVTYSAGVGELANFLLGVSFVVPAGLIYCKLRGRKGALLGGLAGAAIMAGMSMLTNYYITYPIYTRFMPMETIMDLYRALWSGIENLWQALAVVNLPFTLVKGILCTVICFFVYRPIQKIIDR